MCILGLFRPVSESHVAMVAVPLMCASVCAPDLVQSCPHALNPDVFMTFCTHESPEVVAKQVSDVETATTLMLTVRTSFVVCLCVYGACERTRVCLCVCVIQLHSGL